MENENNNEKKNVNFVMLQRGKRLESILKERKSAFCLLTLIATRARWHSEDLFDGLDIGEALIGDYEAYGATEMIYRTDKIFLEKNGLITIRTTNKGTIAKIVDTSIFNINAQDETTKLSTTQRSDNEQITTNNNDNKDNNDKTRLSMEKFQDERAKILLNGYGIQNTLSAEEERRKLLREQSETLKRQEREENECRE